MNYKVSIEDFKSYLDAWLDKKDLPLPFDLIYCKENNKFVALDNTSGDCFVEEFDDEKKALGWLQGYASKEEIEEKEMDDLVFLLKVDYEKNKKEIELGDQKCYLKDSPNFLYLNRYPAIYINSKNKEDKEEYIESKKEILFDVLKVQENLYSNKEIKVYEDDLSKKEFMELLEDLKNRKISVLAVPKLSHLTRNIEILDKLQTITREVNTDVYTEYEKVLPMDLLEECHFQLGKILSDYFIEEIENKEELTM